MHATPLTNVSVRQVDATEVQELKTEYGGARGANLGGFHNVAGALAEETLAAIGEARVPDEKVFLVEWTGSNVARGIEVGGQRITGMQNGMIAGENGVFASYERLVERGGESGKDYKMLVTLD